MSVDRTHKPLRSERPDYESRYVNQDLIDLDLIPSDCSGTIIDDMTPVYNAHARVVKYYKERGVYDGEVPTFDDWLSITHLCTTAVDNYVIWGLDVDKEEAYSLYKRFYRETSKEFEPMPYTGVNETLRWLNEDKAKVVGVISAHPPEALLLEVEKFGLKEYFQFIEGDVVFKADRLIELVESRDLDPKRVGYLCDTPNDLMACFTADVVPIVHPKGYVKEERLDDILFAFEESDYPYRKFYEWPELRRIVI